MHKTADLQGVKFLPVGIEEALQEVIRYIPEKNGDYFCFSNIHVVMESHRNPELKSILNNATANFPDGMGVALALKFLGNTFKGRVRGADFMLKLCSHASKNNFKIFFYGNSESTLSALKEKLQMKGYTIVDEFICPGFNTNSFLKLFGGINKGRPNAEDLKHAETFAKNLKKK